MTEDNIERVFEAYEALKDILWLRDTQAGLPLIEKAMDKAQAIINDIEGV
jgi:hypothetical protein